MIKFVSNLRQVGGFLPVPRFPPGTAVSSTYNTDRHDITEILLKYHNPNLISEEV